ncbi:hypothetical protein BH11PLA2_BH11PLA2_24890 [soil metagenome]
MRSDRDHVLARRCHRLEVDVAQAAVAAATREASHGHVGCYLLGPGRVRFRRDLGEHRPVLRRVRDWLRIRPGIFYFSLLTALTLAVMVPMVILLSSAILYLMPGVVLIGLIASEAGVSLTNFVVRKVTAPRIEYRTGIPLEAATFVVVPTPKGPLPNVLPLLPLLERWKILDNLRRSVVAPAAFVLLVRVCTVLPAPAWVWDTLRIIPLAAAKLEADLG